VINQIVLLKHKQVAFNEWKMAATVDRQSQNKKVQQFFVESAISEVQQNKNKLVWLYQQ
jgi:hypothetical protein